MRREKRKQIIVFSFATSGKEKCQTCMESHFKLGNYTIFYFLKFGDGTNILGHDLPSKYKLIMLEIINIIFWKTL